jgi:hypothetical protein
VYDGQEKFEAAMTMVGELPVCDPFNQHAA